ncbi:phosphate signaling complex protein PhoU [Zavarzinella formosa]|uniref:phosphate signaling complex protein PhoU n=1 Tax=Zavarzinella formosa TaxID=360055 RepID=UPI0002DD0710|nr:phosphate signaling complex protein PhoU [Zavarzinella formosa]
MSRHLERDLEHLQKRIINFAGLVEEVIYKAVQALQEHNNPLAEEIIEGDARIDEIENEVTEECLKLLALHQPVATDLRRIATTLMITTDLERMGDLAKHIAEAALALSVPPVPIPNKMAKMTDVTTSLVRQSLDAFVNLDSKLARRVVRMDDEVDRYNDELIAETIAYMKLNPANIEPGVMLFTATRHLERIADHATNIAEDVIYLVEGDIVKHRPDAIGNE